MHHQLQIWKHRQTCTRQPILGPLKNGCLGQVAILKSTFIKGSGSRCGLSEQGFVFFPKSECIIVNKSSKFSKSLPFWVFWCNSLRCKMFWINFDFEHTYIKACVCYFHKFLFFHQMIALQKLWKMLFISSKRLFSCSRY